MARGPLTFRQRDVTAAIRAAKAAGEEVLRVEIDRSGRIVVVTARGSAAEPQANEWDDLLGNPADVRPPVP